MTTSETRTPGGGLLNRLRGLMGVAYREVVKFGIVGALAFVVDLGLANILWSTVLADRITTAKIISGLVATLVAWVGNRAWTFRHRRNRDPGSEVLLFFAVNIVATIVAAAVLAFSHYGLGLTSALSNNVATVAGIGLGTLVRFFAYRYIVFSKPLTPPEAAAAIADAPPEDVSAAWDPDEARQMESSEPRRTE